MTRVIQFVSQDEVSGASADAGVSTSLSYDDFGNVTATIQDSEHGELSTDTYYDSTYDLYPVQIRNPKGQSEFFHYFYLRDTTNYINRGGKPGLLRGHQQLNGLWLYYFYDSRGRLMKEFQGWYEQRDPDDRFNTWLRPNVAYHYQDAIVGADGRVQQLPWNASWTKAQTYAKQWTTGGTWSHEIYNGFGQSVQTQTPHSDWSVTDNGASGQRIVTDMTYDGSGQVVSQSKPYFVAADDDRRRDFNIYVAPDTNQRRSYTQYDGMRRTVWSQDLNDNTSETVYGNRSVYGRDGRGFVSASYFDMVGQLTTVDEMVATFTDNFNPYDYSYNGFMWSWGKEGNVQETAHVARITGEGDWGDYLYNNLSSSGDQAVQFSFRANTSDTNAVFYLKRGDWGTSSYHRWGIHMTGTHLRTTLYEAGAGQAGFDLMQLTPNKRYNVILRGAQNSDAYLTILVWEDGNPEKRAELRLDKGAGWHQTGWRFYAQVQRGQVDLDDYKELTVNRTHYQYDVQGNLSQVENALGHLTTMEYDWLGRKTRMVDPDMGTWTYQYDKRSNLIRQTDADNTTIAFTYDQLSRLTAKRLGSASGAYLARFEYDGGHSSSNRSLGQRTAAYAYDPPATGDELYHNRIAYSYDEMGRVDSEIRQFRADGLFVYNFEFVYTQGNLPVATIYPDREEVQTTYRWQTGMPISLRQYDDSGNGNKFYDYVRSSSYNEAGQMTEMVYGNGRTATYAYDDGYRMSAMTTLSDDLPDFSYEYDDNSNITHIHETMSGIDQHQVFSYDSLNRLRVGYTGRVVQGSNGQTSYRPIYSNAGEYYNYTGYDALGNITFKRDIHAGESESKRYGYGQSYGIRTGSGQHIHAVTHLNNAQKFVYDANGNMTTRIADGKTWTQTWTDENMLKRATSGVDDVQFFYDADGQMVLRQESGNRKTVILGDGLYESGYVYNEPSKGTEQRKRYVFNGQMVAERQNNSVFFMLNDHLGGVVTSFGGSWGTTQTRRDAWGKERYKNGTIVSNYAFTGQRWDEKLGLYDYNARYYDPSLNRFLSPDTIVPDLANPQSLNRYSYVYNNPLRYSDPSGHTPWDVVDAIFLGISAYQFATNPTWGNAGWLAVDVIGALPLIPSAGYLRYGDEAVQLYNRIADVATTLGRRGAQHILTTINRFNDGGKLAMDFLKIGHIEGAGKIIQNLANGSWQTVKGSRFELEYAVRNSDEIAEIGRRLGGGREIDFVLKNGGFVEAKNYNWASDFYQNAKNLQRTIGNFRSQALEYLKHTDDVTFSFKGSVPDAIRKALEELGVKVEVIR